MKKTASVLTVLLITLLASTSRAELNFVQKVIDAQTLQLINGEIVRLIGVDTSHQPREVPSDIPGAPAVADPTTAFVRSLVSGSVVDLEYDQQIRDDEGRLLAYVWFPYPIDRILDSLSVPDDFAMSYKINELGEEGFYVFLNATMVKTGHAVPAVAEPNVRYTKLFSELHEEHAAKEQKMLVSVEPSGLSMSK